MKKLSPKKEYVAKILFDCIKRGITVKFEDSSVVFGENEDESQGSAGYFECSPVPHIVIATRCSFDEWFRILLHEYTHALMYLDGTCILNKSSRSVRYCNDFWDWLEGKGNHFSKQRIQKMCQVVLEDELECEKRTAQRIRRNPQLKISVERYIKEANAYIFYYNFAQKYRVWCDACNPGSIYSIVKMMPDHFLRVDEYKTTDKYDQLVLRHCLRKKTRAYAEKYFSRNILTF